MIFKPELAAKVMAGTKTRMWRPGSTQRYQVFRDYAVQPGRGKFAIGRLRIIEAAECVLGDTTEEEAILEGFEDLEGFHTYVRALYPGLAPSVYHELLGWAYRFEVEP